MGRAMRTGSNWSTESVSQLDIQLEFPSFFGALRPRESMGRDRTCQDRMGTEPATEPATEPDLGDRLRKSPPTVANSRNLLLWIGFIDISNKCLASSNRCLTSSNKKRFIDIDSFWRLLVTGYQDMTRPDSKAFRLVSRIGQTTMKRMGQFGIWTFRMRTIYIL